MARLSAFRAQLDLAKSNLMGEARRRALIATAKQAFAEADAVNRSALGREVDSVVIVDGRRGAAIESVKAGGTVTKLYAVHQAAIDFTWETLLRLSPIDTSPNADNIVYKDNHSLLVNGTEVEPGYEIQVDDVVTFVNLLPYARSIEHGHSKGQAPNGVYEVTSEIVRARFGNIVTVAFSYQYFAGREAGRHIPTEAGARRAMSYPCITLSPKRRR